MPLTISTLFSSSKPVAAAARPVNAFSSEITTGMSAPPIGSTKRIPNSDAPASTIASSQLRSAPATIATPAPTITANSSPFTICWPTYVIGRPPISSCSFANAIIEPENEIEPISAESTSEIEMSRCRSPESGASRWNSAHETRAAAPPPTPLNSATICGIAVIFTRRAATAPKRAADHHRDDHPDVVVQPVLAERRRDRERHARRADPHAAPRARRVREIAQRPDEGHDRDQVEQVRGCYAPSASFGEDGFRLNISSMRSVTTNPPTTFADPSTTATKPMTNVSVSL